MRRHKVLFVDDEAALLEGVHRALYEEPYEILTATSAAAALVVLESESVDAMVCDQDMPGMKGTELLAMVHGKYPDIIKFMLTGNATLDVAVKAINGGAIRRFFVKPCNHVDLAATLRQALEQKELIDQAQSLLRASKSQSSLIEQLEQEYPGISSMQRDKNGYLVVEDDPAEGDALIAEMNRQAGEAVDQLRRISGS